MAREIVLDFGEGYDPKTAPRVLVRPRGTKLRYSARKPKDTAFITLAEFQMLGLEIQQIGQSISDNPEDANADAAQEQAGRLQERLEELREKLRQLAAAVLSPEDAEDLLSRVYDTSEENAGLGIQSVTDLHEVVQNHFADETSHEYEAMGLQPPDSVKKAAKRTAAKKTAAKSSSRKPARKKAAARP